MMYRLITMELSQIGLIVIMLAWIVQLVSSWKGNQKIQPAFIIGYMLGVALLVISAYTAGLSVSYYELATFVAAGLVLAIVLMKK